MTASDDKAKFQHTYEGWISENGVALTRRQNTNVFSETVYTHRNGIMVSIRQHNDDSDRIILAATMKFPPAVQQQIHDLGDVEQERLSDEVILLMTQMSVQFSFMGENKILQSISVERTVFGGSMTKQIFFDNLYRIIDALVALQTKFRQKLGTVANSTGSGENAANTSSFYG